MQNLFQLLVPIAICCVLPIMIVWLNNRRRIIENNSRTQIVLAAMEKNSDVDIEQLLKKMAPTQKKKLLKEKLLAKLLWGCITLLLGVGLAIFCLCTSFGGGMTPSNLWFSGFMSTIMIAVGIAFLINYFIGKKMLAKEIEAEQNKLSAQA
ncbi:MAG: hypothetical protein IKO46_10540 [Salinivirgaceae bacterium]|nr:hypothetical protein [Salinivirgaceae bacterium]MBR3566932.1 hypothetical protein [Salinivirgaceae bacterium]MBR4621405.1 hypothetical protein [Salinivirgaceae bacterium]